MLKVAGMARSTYYYRLKTLNKVDKYKAVKARLRYLYRRNRGRYGYRRMTAALNNEGIHINHKTVCRLMRAEGIVCSIRQKRRLNKPSPELAAVPNVLNRNFKADEPFQRGVTDVTEFDVGGQRVYLSALIDLYDGAVISLVYSLSNNTDLVMSMYEAIPKKKIRLLDNMLIHSDQGILYRTIRYNNFIRSHHITQSMSRRGNCYDNAVAESFFGTFKSETIRLYAIDTLQGLSDELKAYVKYYNEERIKSTLGYKSPLQYRKDNGYADFL